MELKHGVKTKYVVFILFFRRYAGFREYELIPVVFANFQNGTDHNVKLKNSLWLV